MSEINPSNELQALSVEARAKRRQVLLDEFEERPTDSQLWQAAYEWVRAEGDHPEQASIAADISADELITMADTVRNTPQAERYNLMAQRASNGKYWFDVIEGFSSSKVREGQGNVIRSWVNNSDNPSHFYNALDVGTGVGKSLAILEGSANNVVGLERNPELLKIAKERAGAHTGLVQGSAEQLPFDDASFDLISSQGLRAALDKQATKNFLRELARVLVPGGIYIEGHYLHNEDGLHPEMARFIETSKAMLSDMIGDSTSGALTRIDCLSPEEEEEFLADLGLREEYYDQPDEDGVSHTLITLITKEIQGPHEDDPLSLEIVTVLGELYAEHGFDDKTLEDIKSLPFAEALETAYGYLTQAGLNADEILAQFIEADN